MTDTISPILINAFRRTRTIAILQTALYLLLLVLIIIAQIFLQRSQPSTAYWCINGVFVLGVLMCLLQIVRFGVQTWQNWKPQDSRLLGILRTHPEQVVWLYQTQFPIHLLFFEVTRLPKVLAYLKNGLSIDIHTSQAEQTGVLAELHRLAPQAVVGFREELMNDYRKDPANFGVSKPE